MAYQSISGQRFGETPRQRAAVADMEIRGMENTAAKGFFAAPSDATVAATGRRAAIRKARLATPRSELLAQSRQKSADRVLSREKRRAAIAKSRWKAANPERADRESGRGGGRRGNWGRGRGGSSELRRLQAQVDRLKGNRGRGKGGKKKFTDKQLGIEGWDEE